MSTILSNVDPFDFMTHEATVAVIFGYFRRNQFLNYSIRCNDFVDIISKYINANNTTKFGADNKIINLLNGKPIKRLSALNKTFFVGISYRSRQMYVC